MLCKEDVDEWLVRYEMKAPVTCVTAILSNNCIGLPDLRLDHTHFFSEHGDGGHYYYDKSPETVEYEGYFVFCEKAVKYCPPKINPQRTKFFQGSA
jgi:hypothetical protein